VHAEARELYGMLTGKMHDYLVTVHLFGNEIIIVSLKEIAIGEKSCNCSKWIRCAAFTVLWVPMHRHMISRWINTKNGTTFRALDFQGVMLKEIGTEANVLAGYGVPRKLGKHLFLLEPDKLCHQLTS